MQNLDDSAMGQPAEVNEKTGGKIDYSSCDPIAFKKTATLVNYFIINTAHFLNS